MTEQQELMIANRRRYVRRQARAAVRGVLFALAVIGVVLSGALPMSAGLQSLVLTLAGVLAVTRLMRGLWAARVARHLAWGWHARRLSGPRYALLPDTGRAVAALPPPPESANRRAVMALTDIGDEPLVERAREHGLRLVDRLSELQDVLADQELSPGLRRPVAEESARVEAELETLLSALGELGSADRRQRQDVLARLSARLEIDAELPAGLYAPAG
jgi:hypothetical protein